MKQIFTLLFFCVWSVVVWGQVEIFNEAGGGSAPTGWTFNNNVTSESIDKTTYWLVEDGPTNDMIITTSYDLSAYSSAQFDVRVATFGSGTANPAKIEISYDGGGSYTQTEVTATPSSSSYISGGPIILNAVSSQVVIRISSNGSSGRDVRLQDLVLTAFGPTVGFNDATSTINETNAAQMVTIPVTASNFSSNFTLDVAVTGGGTAEVGDYTLNTSTLSFTGNGTLNISLDINDDADTDDETLEITLSESTSTGVIISPSVHTVTIIDDETPAVPQVLITEVGDPVDNFSRRMVEICNRGSSSVDITGWSLQGDFNGNTNVDFTINVTGSVTLAAGQCYVFANNNFVSSGGILTGCAGFELSGSIDTNGDETFWLNDGSTQIDVYDGQTLNFTDDAATRNAGIVNPNASFTSSEWTVTAANASDLTPCTDATALPISLSSFTAQKINTTTLIQWTTSTEINNDYMAVERSTDGRNFIEIGRVLGAGNTETPQNYQFVDEQPRAGLNYYRLKQVDFDGKYEYHQTVVVEFSGAIADAIQVYPTSTKAELQIVLPDNITEGATMQVIGVDGRVWSQTIVQEKTGQTELSVIDLPAGSYWLKLIDGQSTQQAYFQKY
jgi:hypothetical protein